MIVGDRMLGGATTRHAIRFRREAGNRPKQHPCVVDCGTEMTRPVGPVSTMRLTLHHRDPVADALADGEVVADEKEGQA
ncbi:hypothetical protein [Citreimonas salinaria]|uniref:hypothetical protein n=1 Tax=Citreimonas salinaria TaxID=321339 RepID=UPI0015A5FB0B